MKTILNTALFLFMAVQFAMAQDTIPTLTIDSTLVVGDSAHFKNNLRVEGVTTMRDNATASRDLTVEGNAYFKINADVTNQLTVHGPSEFNSVKVGGDLTLTGLHYTEDSDNTTVLVLGENGIVKSFGLDALLGQLYKKDCGTGSIIPAPVWNNGPNKVFLPCDVKVGVNTSDPLYSLDVRGFGYLQAGLRVGNISTGSFSTPALIEAERSSNYVNPFIRMSEKQADGTNQTRFKVDADGTVWCTEVHVRSTTAIPDYVFKPQYGLMPLNELRTFVTTHSHLPNIPGEADMLRNGTDLNEMQMKLLEKVEELTLYILELDAKNAGLEKQIEALKAANN